METKLQFLDLRRSWLILDDATVLPNRNDGGSESRELMDGSAAVVRVPNELI